MKKFITTLVAALMIGAMLTACGGDTGSTNSGENAKEPAATQTQEKKKSSEGDIGNYHVKLLDAEVTKDFEGNPAIRVSYEFTNNDKEAVMASIATPMQAYQDGVQLEIAISADEDQEYNNSALNVKKGATLKCAQYFELTSEDSEVEVEVSDILGMSDPLTKTYTIK